MAGQVMTPSAWRCGRCGGEIAESAEEGPVVGIDPSLLCVVAMSPQEAEIYNGAYWRTLSAKRDGRLDWSEEDVRLHALRLVLARRKGAEG